MKEFRASTKGLFHGRECTIALNTQIAMFNNIRKERSM